ncbi:TPA: glycosyltransferase [Vibrio antiquarius]
MTSNKILIVQNSVKTIALFRLEYIKHLLDSGYHVVVLAPNDCEQSLRKIEQLGVLVDVVKIPVNKLGKFKQVYVLNKKLREYGVRGYLIVIHFLVTFLTVYPTLLTSNFKIVLSVEGLGSIFTRSTVLQKILRRLVSSKNITRVFCNVDERKLLGKKCDFVTNGIGVDTKKFSPKAREKNTKPITIIYVGRLVKDKGVHIALGALRSLLDNNYDVKGIFIGSIYKDNPTSLSEREINALSEELGDNIHFTGHVEDVREHYDNADILLLPSIREGFPVCVMEASSMGVISICFDVAGCNSAIENGKNGFLVEDLSEASFNKCVMEAIESNAHIRLKKDCVVHARLNFERAVKAQEFCNFIKRV